MKKIDILNFITSNRKFPNNIKAYSEIFAYLPSDEGELKKMLTELQESRIIKETEKNGEKAYQVISR